MPRRDCSPVGIKMSRLGFTRCQPFFTPRRQRDLSSLTLESTADVKPPLDLRWGVSGLSACPKGIVLRW